MFALLQFAEPFPEHRPKTSTDFDYQSVVFIHGYLLADTVVGYVVDAVFPPVSRPYNYH